MRSRHALALLHHPLNASTLSFNTMSETFEAFMVSFTVLATPPDRSVRASSAVLR